MSPSNGGCEREERAQWMEGACRSEHLPLSSAGLDEGQRASGPADLRQPEEGRVPGQEGVGVRVPSALPLSALLPVPRLGRPGGERWLPSRHQEPVALLAWTKCGGRHGMQGLCTQIPGLNSGGDGWGRSCTGRAPMGGRTRGSRRQRPVVSHRWGRKRKKKKRETGGRGRVIGGGTGGGRAVDEGGQERGRGTAWAGEGGS